MQVTPSPESAPERCGGCGERLRLSDLHCDACGKQVSPGQRQAISVYVDAQRLKRLRTARTLNQQINRASGVIGLLSLLFFLSAIAMWVQGRNEMREARELLAAAPEEKTLTVAGETMTVGEAQKRVRQVPIKLFIVNFVLACIMLALHFWARISPLPAILVATSVFLMVHVVNFVLVPESLKQGMVIKVFAIVALAAGIHAAIQHRGQRGPAGTS